jgi:hypothetical protein
MRNLILTWSIIIIGVVAHSQQIPSIGENVTSLVTFGDEGKTEYGDDDFSQTVFLLIPKNYQAPFYLRIFDPAISGEMDEINGANTTITTFEIYGGDSAYTHPDAQGHNPIGNYKSGVLIRSKTFGSELDYDGKWYSLGPFNPIDGEFVEYFQGYLFQVVIEGSKGDDGNLYRLFLSSERDNNYGLEGSNLFTFEYSIRLVSKAGETAHLYPFIDEEVKSIKVQNFDFDNDGEIKIYSVSKNGILSSKSGNDEWREEEHLVVDEERGTSLNLQIVKKGNWNNDMTIYVTNQYDEDLPFFSIPIGGVPKYKYKVNLRYKSR